MQLAGDGEGRVQPAGEGRVQLAGGGEGRVQLAGEGRVGCSWQEIVDVMVI